MALALRALLSFLPRRTVVLLSSLLAVLAEGASVAFELLLDELALEGALFVLSAIRVLGSFLIVLELSGRELLIVELLDIPQRYLIASVGLMLLLVLLNEVVEGNVSHLKII